MENRIRDNFSIITNNIVNDERISFGAKGVACYLLSKPVGWQFYLADIQNHSNESILKVKKYIKELETIGFLVRIKLKNDKGQFIGLDYKFNLDYTQSIPPENRQTENPTAGETAGRETISYNNTNNNNTNLINTNNSIILGKHEKFIKPTIEEIKSYCLEKGISLDAEKFYYYYESKGWMIGKNKMKSWKAAIMTWKRNTQTSNTANEFLELGRV